MVSSIDDKMNRPSSSLTISSSDFNQQNFERIYDKFKSNKAINEVNIMLNNGHNYEIKFLDERTIDSIVINDGNIDAINKFYGYLVNKGYEIDNIIIDVDGINYENIDLSSLMEIRENCNITFKYSTLDEAGFDDFWGLVEAMKWYRSMIDDEMSPAEKLMFAYDILKTFEYHENQYNKDNSRAPHSIIRDGDIVCVGYTSLLRELLKNKDDNLKVGAVSVTCYYKNGDYRGSHSRGLVSIDDDKYDIHGIFIDDPTWDSYNRDGKYSLGKDYNALDLYQYFLIPKSDYRKVFPHDSIPNIFNTIAKACDNGPWSRTLSLDSQYNMALYDSALKNKDNISSEEIEKRINMAKRPSLATFNEILYNVRLKEGYSSDQAWDDISRVNKENMDLSIMTSEFDENNFFQNSKDDINKK